MIRYFVSPKAGIGLTSTVAGITLAQGDKARMLTYDASDDLAAIVDYVGEFPEWATRLDPLMRMDQCNDDTFPDLINYDQDLNIDLGVVNPDQFTQLRELVGPNPQAKVYMVTNAKLVTLKRLLRFPYQGDHLIVLNDESDTLSPVDVQSIRQPQEWSVIEYSPIIARRIDAGTFGRRLPLTYKEWVEKNG